jgi:hypothetical protein
MNVIVSPGFKLAVDSVTVPVTVPVHVNCCVLPLLMSKVAAVEEGAEIELIA